MQQRIMNEKKAGWITSLDCTDFLPPRSSVANASLDKCICVIGKCNECTSTRIDPRYTLFCILHIGFSSLRRRQYGCSSRWCRDPSCPDATMPRTRFINATTEVTCSWMQFKLQWIINAKRSSEPRYSAAVNTTLQERALLQFLAQPWFELIPLTIFPHSRINHASQTPPPPPPPPPHTHTHTHTYTQLRDLPV